MRYFIQFGLSVIITCSMGYAENLKECLSEEDKIQGCVKKLWFSNGYGLVLETPYKNGKLDGIEKRYYLNNGNLDQETPYKNGKEDGIEKGYDENGNLERETPYKDGKQDGVEKWYYENGDLIAEITYKNEKIISGKCGDGKAFSNAHLHNLEKHYDIDFIIKKICEKP